MSKQELGHNVHLRASLYVCSNISCRQQDSLPNLFESYSTAVFAKYLQPQNVFYYTQLLHKKIILWQQYNLKECSSIYNSHDAYMGSEKLLFCMYLHLRES